MTESTPPNPQQPAPGQQPYQQPAPELQYQQPTPGQQQYPYPGPAAHAPVAPQDERTWSILAHAGGIVVGFIAPLIVWLVYKDRSRRLDHQGKEALNFQLTLLIAYVGIPIAFGIISIVPVIGLISLLIGPLLFATWACAIVFGIMGAMAASRDEWYVYPVKIPFIK